MANYCKLTGVELSETQECPLKKMCLNCKSLVDNGDGTFSCNNEKVMDKGREKILAAVPDGFEIASLELKPMALKVPSKKCPNYTPNEEMIMAEIKNVYGF